MSECFKLVNYRAKVYNENWNFILKLNQLTEGYATDDDGMAKIKTYLLNLKI